MTEENRARIREALAGNKKLTMMEISKATGISSKVIGFELDQMFNEGELMKCTFKKTGARGVIETKARGVIRWMLSDRGL